MSLSSGRLTILHLSDLHATASGLLYDTVDTLQRIDQVADYAIGAGITPEAVVVTGDLIQRGHRDAYPALSDALRRLGERVGAPVHTVLGNHDDPFAARILPGHRDAHARVVELDTLRLILLDSHSGALSDAQHDLVADTLATRFGMGTVIALHHAPLGSPMPVLAKQGLRHPERLIDLLDGSDCRLILAGHFHHPLSATVSGIPISVGPSLAYHQVMNAGPAAVSGVDAPMFSLVHLTATSVSTSAIALHSPAPLFSAPVAP